MTEDWPTVRLELESKPETLTLVRAALGGLAEVLSIDAELLDDLKTAISEACNNVVMHAYGDEIGPLSVCLFVGDGEIEAVVSDRGRGLPQPTPIDDRALGVGLPVIQALASHSEFVSKDGGGTEVRMAFAATRGEQRLFQHLDNAAPENGWMAELSGDAVVSLSPVTVLSSVLGRLARALAATARFSLDRFSDVYLVTDALAAYASNAASSRRIGFGIAALPRRLEVTIGPFLPGSGNSLREQGIPAGAASPLRRLSDELVVEQSDHGEKLRLVLVDHRR